MLNISKQIYAGWSSTTQGLHEAEIIPNGDSANEKKKINTFTHKWKIIKEFDNVPLPGFTLVKSGKKNWSSTETSWVVIDPRGFTVRISSNNLEKILQVSGITENLIQQRCVWAREDSQTKMTLVPVTAEIYNQAVKNTILIEEKVKLADVQIGDKVLLQSNIIGRYLGTLSLYGKVEACALSLSYRVTPKLRKQIIEVAPGRYFYQTDAKILKILEKTDKPLTRAQAADIINNEISAKNGYFNSFTRFSLIMNGTSVPSYHDHIHYASTDASSVKLSFKEITKEEAAQEYYDCSREYNASLIFETKKGVFHLLDCGYDLVTTNIMSFETKELTNFDKNSTIEELTCVPRTRSSFYHKTTSPRYGLDDFEKFYIVVKHVKKSTYL